MAKNYRYTLDPSSRKYICPNCGKKRFVRLVDRVANELAPAQYGKCDRAGNCSYKNFPRSEGKTGNQFVSRDNTIVKRYYIPNQVLLDQLLVYKETSFYTNLKRMTETLSEGIHLESVIRMYLLGGVSSGFMKGGTTFPYIDYFGKINAIQVLTFYKENHRKQVNFYHHILKKEMDRVGENYPQWLTNYLKNEKIIRCFFGEHLLRLHPQSPVGIVESPKTAIYLSLLMSKSSDNAPIFLSSFNLQGLSLDKCQILKNRNVVLFPDLSSTGRAFELWLQKMREIKKHVKVKSIDISNYLEILASNEDRRMGNDLADYLFNC